MRRGGTMRTEREQVWKRSQRMAACVAKWRRRAESGRVWTRDVGRQGLIVWYSVGSTMRCSRTNGRVGVTSHRGGGFTLVEVLAVISIVALMLAIILPAVSHVQARSRGFRCQMSIRSIAFDFGIFADETLHGDRGNDAEELGSRLFRLETFQESQYGIDEFWRWGEASTHAFPDSTKADPMRCSSVRGDVVVWKNAPCSQGGVGPPSSISYTFNARLHVGEVVKPNGMYGIKAAHLDSTILTQGMVPLAWDVDGAAANAKGFSPVFSAPAMGSKVVFSNDKFWFPAMRHAGSLNIAFVDGHVASSSDPLDPSHGWRWEFQGVK